MKKKTNEQFLKDIEGRGITPLEPYTGCMDKILFSCDVDGYQWRTTPNHILTGTGCSKCANKRLREERLILNKIIDTNGEVITLDISNTKEPNATMLIDIVDWEFLQRLEIGRVTPNFHGYPAAHIKQKIKKLHRLLNPSWKITDHINGNKCDNRRVNLREVSKAQNAWNRGLLSSNTSGVSGVHFNKYAKKWQATIGYNGKNRHLGYFVSFEDAVKKRAYAELELFGEYSRGIPSREVEATR